MKDALIKAAKVSVFGLLGVLVLWLTGWCAFWLYDHMPDASRWQATLLFAAAWFGACELTYSREERVKHAAQAGYLRLLIFLGVYVGGSNLIYELWVRGIFA